MGGRDRRHGRGWWLQLKKTKVEKHILSDMPESIFQIILLCAKELIIQAKLVQSVPL